MKSQEQLDEEKKVSDERIAKQKYTNPTEQIIDLLIKIEANTRK